MKKHLLLFSMLLLSGLTYAQTAQILVAHNSPDAALNEADIYITYAANAGGNIKHTVQDVEFRNAVPIQEVDAGQVITVYFALSNSADETEAVYSQNIGPLNDGDVYVVVANGILSTSTGYTANPAFNFDVFTAGRTEASTAGNTDVLFLNGCPDAPEIDIYQYGVPTPLTTDLGYGDFSADYVELLSSDETILDIKDPSNGNYITSYLLPLEMMMLENEAGVVLASGFGEPLDNNDGPAVGLFYLPMEGGPFYELMELPAISFVQIIHGSADDALSMVDIYVDSDGDITKFDDVEFLTATEFSELPAEVSTNIIIAPSNSTSEADGFYTESLGSLDRFTGYIAVINGINSSTGYSPAPALQISVYADALEEANNSSNVDILFFHGSTDASEIDVVDPVTTSTLVDDLGYGDFSDYVEFSFVDHIIDVTDASGSSVVASYSVPFTTSDLQGSAAVVLALGFDDPTANSNGLPFGLYVASPDGGDLFELPTVVTSTVNQLNDAQMSVFPVPANDAVTVSLQSAGTVEVISAQGEVVMTTSANSGENKLDVSSLNSGVYTLRVISEDKVGVRRIVIAE